MTKRQSKKTPQRDLPPKVLPRDLDYPRWSDDPRKDDTLPREVQQEMGIRNIALKFYQVKGPRIKSWVLITLFISKGNRSSAQGASDRNYGITVDGDVCRVGRGPHVVQEVTVYLSKSNIGRLKEYVGLFQEGLQKACQIRDRISTRRAQGQVHRANGEHTWSW